MKVLLNMAAERVADLGRWCECEGVRLVETKDGSLNLEITTDLAASQEVEKSMRELFSGWEGSH